MNFQSLRTPGRSAHVSALLASALLAPALLLAGTAAVAQTTTPAPAAATPGTVSMAPLDMSSMDRTADPCTDFYQYACGNFAKNHPIPADHASIQTLGIINDQVEDEVHGLLVAAADGGGTAAGLAARTPAAQKVGDYFTACMNTAAIDAADLHPVQPLLDEINATGKLSMLPLIGKLQRLGVNVFFQFGSMQDPKDATREIAVFDQGGLGLPEKDYYLRTGARDEEIRKLYREHIVRMLSFGGDSPQLALRMASPIVEFETTLAKASQGIVERRDPLAVYHLQPLSTLTQQFSPIPFTPFLEATHAPLVKELNVVNPAYAPALIRAVRDTDINVLRAYMRYQVLTAFARELPTPVNTENFHFYANVLEGVPEQRPRWKQCGSAVQAGLGEALGKLYVDRYFSPATRAATLQLVHDIEGAMATDINGLPWMSAATKVRAEEKLHLVADKIGYPTHFRDYSTLTISPTDALGDLERANAFENDRELAKIGKPVDRQEWGMPPSEVNAYYDPSMNDINFPAAILQPPLYSPDAPLPVNYGHAGMVVGHELTHGFDDEGRKYDGHGNLSDEWTAADVKNFTERTSCESKEYSAFSVGTGAAAVHLNGDLTLGENTADNGGTLLAYMAMLKRAKESGYDLAKKVDGFDGRQQFFVATAQNWCANARDESLRNQVLTDPHSPDRFRVNGVIPNQPAFREAFSCKAGTPMAPVNTCRVW